MNLKRAISLALLFAAGAAQAQFVTGRFVTSFSTWQKFDTVGVSSTYLRAFQTVQLSATEGNVSLHTMFQGAVNTMNAFGDNGRVRFYNLFLSVEKIASMLDVDLGRQAVYAGVGNGTIDGIKARANFLNSSLSVTAYGGGSVNGNYTSITSSFSNNFAYGGQITTSIVDGARFGVSYMKRKEELDPFWTERIHGSPLTTLPTATYIAPDAAVEELGGVDASYSYESLLSAYGRLDYDLQTQATSRAQGGARVNVTNDLAVTADYLWRAPRLLYNTFFSVFTSNAINEIEGGLEYSFAPRLRAFARLANVSYTDDKSMRWSAGVNTGYGTFVYTGSNGYAGEQTTVSAQGAYPLFENMLVPSAGIAYTSYKLSADAAQQSALSILLGTAVRPSKAFSVDLQGQWLTNKIMSRDVRLQARVNYWFAERLSIFSQEAQ